MHSTGLTTSLLATAAFISSTIASPILETRSINKRAFSQPNLAVYYGQGPNQKRLVDFCADTTIDIIPIGFVNIFPDQEGGPGTNYGSACGGTLWTAPDGTQTQVFETCYQIAEDIPKCQAMGKKVLASIGGASPGNFIASTESAKAFADFLWGSFGPLQDPTLKQYPRPFGSAVTVDGFDLDIESGGDFGYADLVNELRTLFAGQNKKTYYISSAPQCVVPDSHVGDAIKNAPFDYVFVQYYNTDQCSARSLFSSGTLNTNTDITYGWASWLQQNSKNPNVKLYLGLPASTIAAHSQDYLNLDEAKSLIEEYACSNTYQSIFGGVMLWEATYSENNQINDKSYAANIKDIFAQLSCAPPPPATTSTSTTTTTTTTTLALTTTTATTTITTTEAALTTTATTTSRHEFPHGSSSTTSDTTSSTFSSTVAPVPTTTTTSETTTTTSYSHPIGPIGGTTSSSSPETSSTTTSYSHQVGPIGGSTTSSSSEAITSSTSSTTTSSSHAVGPIGGTTLTSSSPTTTLSSETTTSEYTHSFTHSSPIGGTTSSSSSTTTSAYVSPVTTSSSTTTYPGTWADWTTSTTSAYVGPVTTSSSTTTYPGTWADWTTSTTNSIVVNPTASSTTISSATSSVWEDWPATTTTTSASTPVEPDYTTTVWTTSYIDICPTGFTTRPFTLTTTVPVAPATTTAPFVWPTQPNGCPRGFSTTVTACSVCAETIVTVTLTIPTPTATAVETQTVVPVKPTAPAAAAPVQPSSDHDHPIATLSTATKPTSETPVAPIGASTPSSRVTVSLETVAPASTSPASNSGWLAPEPAGPSPSVSTSAPASPVVPVNAAQYTGGAAQDELPGTVMSVAVCVVVAVAGLLF